MERAHRGSGVELALGAGREVLHPAKPGLGPRSPRWQLGVGGTSHMCTPGDENAGASSQ